MANYEKARVKLTNTQLNKLKSAEKSKAGAKNCQLHNCLKKSTIA